MLETREETDSFGAIFVPANRYWGAQTQRSLERFKIGDERMPEALICAFGLQKRVCAEVNMELGILDAGLGRAIVQAADEVSQGLWGDHFPLSVWQTGSGTQTHMNVNEVIANRAIEILGGAIGSKQPVHPNDHVNKSQSSNDSFPTVMHLAVVLGAHGQLIPSLEHMATVLSEKCAIWSNLIKIGRTHLQDATPMTIGQEFSAFEKQIRAGIQRVESALEHLYALAQGGTAVGTGLNAPEGFGVRFAEKISALTQLPFYSASNKFEAIATHDALVAFSGVLNGIAVALLKIANDIRLLGSGPRCGLGELLLPANEPGSSIMPGKVNPTQAEALAMVAVQVMGHHAAISIAGSQGHLQLNTFKPVIVFNVLKSIGLLADAVESFTVNCLKGLAVNSARVQKYVEDSLMLATALNPHIGYDNAAAIAKYAHERGTTLRQAAVDLELVTDENFSLWINPQEMVSQK